MTLPCFKNYGNYSSNNYGVNSLMFTVGNVTVYFSYKTPVAFRTDYGDLVVRKNEWGPTTGKHLNWIDGGDKKDRISGDEFKKKLQEVLNQ